MDKRDRIIKTDWASLGNHSWHFKFPRGEYTLNITNSIPEFVVVKFLDETERWPVQLEERNGSEFKLSSFADWTPELLEYVCWFELLVSPKTKITYWGEKEIYRTDFCVQP